MSRNNLSKSLYIRELNGVFDQKLGEVDSWGRKCKCFHVLIYRFLGRSAGKIHFLTVDSLYSSWILFRFALGAALFAPAVSELREQRPRFFSEPANAVGEPFMPTGANEQAGIREHQ
jgi:hypothetical protein